MLEILMCVHNAIRTPVGVAPLVRSMAIVAVVALNTHCSRPSTEQVPAAPVGPVVVQKPSPSASSASTAAPRIATTPNKPIGSTTSPSAAAGVPTPTGEPLKVDTADSRPREKDLPKLLAIDPATVKKPRRFEPADAMVVVVTLIDGKPRGVCTGLVEYSDGDRSYIQVIDGHPGRPLGASEPPSSPKVRFVALVGTKEQQVPVELEALELSEPPNYIGIRLSGLRDELPPPVKRGQLPPLPDGAKLKTLSVELPLNLTQTMTFAHSPGVAEIFGATKPQPLPELVGREAFMKLERVYIMHQGATGGVALNGEGEIVGIIRSSREERKWLHATSTLAPLEGLAIQVLRIRETVSGSQVKLEFLLRTRDLYPKTHSPETPRILITHGKTGSSASYPADSSETDKMFRFADGAWQKPAEGFELELTPVTTWDKSFELSPASPKLNPAHWSGSYTFSMDEKSLGVYYCCVGVDPTTRKIASRLGRDSFISAQKKASSPILFGHRGGQTEILRRGE